MSLELGNRMLPAAGAAILWALPVLADTPQAGFESETLPYPGQALTATLGNGEVVVFDGMNIDLYDEVGVLIQNLGTLPAFAFGSFLVIDPSETFAVVGESSTHDLWRVSLDGSGVPTAFANLVFNYDAVFEDAEHLIVSAAICGFGCGNQIFRVNTTTGDTTQLARVTGASGPLAVDDHGNLYYATASAQFPPPDFPSEIIRWDAAQLTGAPVVSESDAALVATGLEGASDLVFDPLDGGLFLAANNFGTGVNVIRQILGDPVNAPILFEGLPFSTISNLEFLPGDGQAKFLGYQPASGGRLLYNTTDFATVFERRALRPRRPQAVVSGPGTTGAGQFTVSVVHGPPNGSALVYYGIDSLYDPNETVIDLRVPLFVGLHLPTLGRVPGMIQLDANGGGFRDYQNPGGFEGMFAIQLLLLDDLSRIAGMSTAAFL